MENTKFIHKVISSFKLKFGDLYEYVELRKFVKNWVFVCYGPLDNYKSDVYLNDDLELIISVIYKNKIVYAKNIGKIDANKEILFECSVFENIHNNKHLIKII